jgi:hypothetical protein
MPVQVIRNDKQMERAARLARNPAALQKFRESENGRAFDKRLDSLKRQDSAYAQSSGLTLARELEHIYSEVMRNDYPDNNALALFPIDRSVPAGAKTHTVKRVDVQGRAKVHRGKGDDLPTVSLNADEESFPVLYYTIAVEWDHFDEMAAGFAGANLLDESLTGARDIMLEFWNEKTWNGDEENGLYGVLNYPYINKYVMGGVVFEHGGDATAMLSALQRLVDYPGELNKGKGILRPNQVVVSVRLKQIIEGTFFAGTEGPTVLSRFEASKGVKVVAAWEMQGTGPGGTDQILVYKAGDTRSIANVTPMGFTQLPTQGADGFDYRIPCFMAHGGIIMRKALMNVIGYASVNS